MADILSEVQNINANKNVPIITDQFLKMADVVKIVGFSRHSIYKWIKAGSFPKSIPCGGNEIRFSATEIQTWMNDRIARRDAEREKQESA